MLQREHCNDPLSVQQIILNYTGQKINKQCSHDASCNEKLLGSRIPSVIIRRLRTFPKNP